SKATARQNWFGAFIIFTLTLFFLLYLVYALNLSSSELIPLTIALSSILSNFAVIFFYNYRLWHFFGLIINKYTLPHFIYGFTLPLLLFLPIFFVLFIHGIKPVGLSIGGLLKSAYIIGFFALNEELIFRGILFQMLVDKRGNAWGIFLSSIVFATAHLFNPNIGIVSFMNIFLAGVILGLMYIKTGLLWLSVGFHFGWNLWQILLLGSPTSGINSGTSIFETNITQLEPIFFGGSFGIEGGLVATILLLITAYIVSSRFVPCPEIISKMLREKYTYKFETNHTTTSSR
ncbi:MAG: lysostaphin resistance A-like protein, partial [Candidatus Kapaibacteriota bacterium]